MDDQKGKKNFHTLEQLRHLLVSFDKSALMQEFHT